MSILGEETKIITYNNDDKLNEKKKPIPIEKI